MCAWAFWNHSTVQVPKLLLKTFWLESILLLMPIFLASASLFGHPPLAHGLPCTTISRTWIDAGINKRTKCCTAEGG